MTLDTALASIRPLDSDAMRAADDRQAQLTKPPRSMGRLEPLGRQLAGIARCCPPPVPEPVAVVVFAGDHGVHAQGVTTWPQEVTAQMVANVCAGGAVVSVLGRQVGADVTVVDAGVVGDLPAHPALTNAKVARGTRDLSLGAAMTSDECRGAVEAGLAEADRLADAGYALLVTGDLGLANTTPSAALVAALTGSPPELVTGRGSGSDDATLARKTAVVSAAVVRCAGLSPLGVLAEVGGFEHAALAGFMIGGAARGIPVVLDGVIACSAALVAVALAPHVSGYLVAGHRSQEPGASAALAHLGLEPLLDLDLRLGEGSGAVLAVPLAQAAARILGEVATFASAAVSGR